jgi:hypothetical protein
MTRPASSMPRSPSSSSPAWSSGNVTLTATEYRRAIHIKATGAATDGRNVTLQAIKKLSIVSNFSTTHAVDFKLGAATITLGPAEDAATPTMALVYTDGTANGLFAVSSGVGGGDPSAADFLTLTDTPEDYSGQNGMLVGVNPSEDGLEFVEPPVVPAAANWGMSFRGALIDRSSNHSDELTATGHGLVTGDGPFYVATSSALPGGLSASTRYWAIRVDDNTLKLATSRANALALSEVDITSAGTGTHTITKGRQLVVPAGVTRLRFTCGLDFEAGATAGSLFVSLHKNVPDAASGGALTYGAPLWMVRQSATGYTNNAVFLASTPISVAEGDLFSIRVNVSGHSGLDQILATQYTYFAVEVVEVANPPALHYDFGFAKAGTPEAAEVVGKVMIARDIIIPADFEGSAGHVDVKPDDPFAIDVTVDAVSIGTITIDDEGDFTFETVANEAKEIGVGSVVRFVDPIRPTARSRASR